MLDSLMPLGKHKGTKTVKEVIDTDPNYLRWFLKHCIKNIKDDPLRAWFNMHRWVLEDISCYSPVSFTYDVKFQKEQYNKYLEILKKVPITYCVIKDLV